jgi:hypothetical protein
VGIRRVFVAGVSRSFEEAEVDRFRLGHPAAAVSVTADAQRVRQVRAGNFTRLKVGKIPSNLRRTPLSVSRDFHPKLRHGLQTLR